MAQPLVQQLVIQGMGALPCADGVAFRVWAPHASAVSVVGSFNNWDASAHPMQSEPRGYWYVFVERARIGDPYSYQLSTEWGVLRRMDPYAREVTHSAGDSIVHDPTFAWDDGAFSSPPWNELVIYQLHVGTFNEGTFSQPGQFSSVTARLDHLKQLGINAIEIMPVGQFAGNRSWGCNPSHIFAVESDYGGSLGLKRFIQHAHRLTSAAAKASAGRKRWESRHESKARTSSSRHIHTQSAPSTPRSSTRLVHRNRRTPRR